MSCNYVIYCIATVGTNTNKKSDIFVQRSYNVCTELLVKIPDKNVLIDIIQLEWSYLHRVEPYRWIYSVKLHKANCY